MLSRSRISGLLITAAVGSVVGCFSFAQAEETSDAASPPAIQSCLVAPAKLADKDVGDFVTAPNALLSENPAGGLPMSNRVRELAGSSSAAFEAILAQIKSANDGQKSAIAAGFARVVAACGPVNPDYAAAIQNAVAGLGDPVLIAAYAQATNDIKVAAVGVAGAASFAGGGATGTDSGDQSSGTNSYQYPDSSGVDTDSGSYDIGSPNSVSESDTVTTTVLSSTSPVGG
jgi:hypothetical protein